jgi:hypothetical protein
MNFEFLILNGAARFARVWLGIQNSTFIIQHSEPE